MATIRARKKADGTLNYCVQIRLKKKGVHSLSRSSDIRPQAGRSGLGEATRDRARCSLRDKVDSEICQQMLVDYALWRMSPVDGGIRPQTAGNDLAHLGSVLSLAMTACLAQNG